MCGEIEMVADATGQLVIGIRGELDHAAAARKRKADRPEMGAEPRGKGQRPSSKIGSPVRDQRSGGGPPWKKALKASGSSNRSRNEPGLLYLFRVWTNLR